VDPSALVGSWYSALGVFTRLFAEPIKGVSDGLGIAPVSAVLLGLIGALSPCQLTTGISALALIGRRPSPAVLVAGVSYTAGKAIVYALIGLAFVLLGSAASSGAIPGFVLARKLLGPLMLVVGLVLIGLVRLRVPSGIGDRIALYASDRLDATRPVGAFFLGAAFSVAFCPTLFVLFFGLLIPLALASPGGPVYPALFALGTTLPMLVVLGVLALGSQRWSVAGALTRAQPFLTQLAGFVVVAAGVNDTIVYWFI
jgi:cytochrome c biogenesis protein CcdA